jgi:methylated-DNA-[protein]-cysteine S-methyltransferase
MNVSSTEMSSPIGRLRLSATDEGLCAIDFDGPHAAYKKMKKNGESSSRSRELLRKAENALTRYFAGEMEAFTGVPLDFSGTPFQKKVWAALLKIPAGNTRSYADIARAIGNPKAVRAVGSANGANPIPIIVPCHRVIGADGSLTGYGGGCDRKEWLLKHEGALLV